MNDAEAFKAFEAEGWTAQACTYDLLTARITAPAMEPLLDAAGVTAGARVLDVGTGIGTLAAAAAARGARATGVDLAKGMLAVARERNPAIEFVTGDAEELPFADGAFDAAVGAFVLNHLPRPERGAAELHRVLAPGGRAALAVWDAPERMRVLGVLGDAFDDAAAERPAELAGGPDPYRFADPAELRVLLAGAGFEEVEVRDVRFAHRMAGPDELWDGLLGGSVRGASTVRAQDERTRARVRAAFDRRVAPYRTSEGGLEVPVAMRIGLGRGK